MEHFENPNPTETEQVMFYYAGLYLVKKTSNIYMYAPVHPENTEEFPYTLDIDTNLIKRKDCLVFELMSETVCIPEYYDMDLILLIVKRMEELGFQKFLGKGSYKIIEKREKKK